MLKIGSYELHSIVTGSVWLDGGAMFGVVPKVLWDKVTDVDDLNRIPLATRTLLAVDRGQRRVVLVDTGCGSKWAQQRAERFAIKHDDEAIARALASMDLSNEDVTDVVITHLHFDHNGGLTDWYDEPDGPTCLRYPNANHWVHRKHWEHANKPTAKDRASFLPEDFGTLVDREVLRLVEGENPNPPFDGMEWFVSRGHTPYQLHPIFTAGDQRLMFVGDLVPTVAHLPISWVMAYDLAPLQTLAEKEAIS